MSTGVAIAVGLIVGFTLATILMSSPGCCATLGKVAFAKYGIGDPGQGIDATAGGLISQLGLA